MSDIELRVEDRTGRILLNRPQAINALNLAMIDEMTHVLEDWAHDDRVDEVLVEGAGRGFCAGADVRQMRQMILDGSGDPVDYLRQEYRLDYLIAVYPKPYTARMAGIVMGGGMGISVHGSHRIVTGSTAMAMPETNIGLWPDVGMTYHLSRIPGGLGTFMGLTGLSVTADQAIRAGLADMKIGNAPGGDAPADSSARGDASADGASDDSWMDDCFAPDRIGEIVDRLENSELPQARDTARTLRSRCPLSVVVTLRALRRAATMTLEEVFAQDLRLGAFFCGRPDFVEGVRAQLVDKDYAPHWSHSRIEDVREDDIRAAFGD